MDRVVNPYVVADWEDVARILFSPLFKSTPKFGLFRINPYLCPRKEDSYYVHSYSRYKRKGASGSYA